MKKILSVVAVATLLLVACNKPKATVVVPVMQTSADSMSYVIGLNLGRNLIGIDSLLNVNAVCEGLRDAYLGAEKLNAEEARAAYLKYMNYDVYERVAAFEEQFLEDLRKEDRKFVATNSGLTYKVHTLGNMKRVARNNRDTILVCYRALDVAGEVVDTTYLHGDTLRIALGDMPRGVVEATKLIGKGGHLETWVPSRLAFGSAGCDSLSILPNTMLYYELWLIDVEER